MAILQLSRITHRKGLSENLPQLAGAELGWVLDERRLFVGNGTVEEGAPVIGNTEILTEFSDILALSSTYTYKGLAAGYVVSTGENDEAIYRSLQSKYDDFASVKDFGALGDGEADDTDAINRALYELFCRELNTEVRRSLYFPAGTYKVSGTIKIPPHAKLYGEGLTSSVIKFVATEVVATELVAGDRYEISFVGTSDFTAVGAASNTIGTVFIATGTTIGTGIAKALPLVVVETADSLQQTGANIGNNGAVTPTGIEMSSMAVYSTEDNSLLKLDSLTDSAFSYLGLHGPRVTATESQTVGNATSAIEIASTNITSHDITITKMDTMGTTYGLSINDPVKGVVFENSGLDYHYIACRVGSPIVSTGPTGVVITRNIFDNIALQGIIFGDVLFNSSAYNVFYDVGNNFSVSPVVPVIQMDGSNCISVGDLFERTDEEEEVHPRIALFGNGGIAIDGTHSIHLGSFERQVGIAATLTDNTTAGSVFTFTSGDPVSFKVDYNISRNFETRMGSMYVSNNGTSVNYNEEFTQSVDLGVTLDVVGSTTDSELQFTSTSTGNDATINYSIVRLD